jgi:hypothetical protein
VRNIARGALSRGDRKMRQHQRKTNPAMLEKQTM